PARAHRLEHVGVVVADELVHDAPADRERVPEALVALDELFDRYASPCADAELAHGVLELARVVALEGSRRAGRIAGLHDHRVADPLRKEPHLVGVIRSERLRAGHARAA